MKILLVDCMSYGHHLPYLNNILSIRQENISFSIVAPSSIPEENRHYELSFPDKKNLFQYCYARQKWLASLAHIAKKVKPDIIHFLYGDAIYQLAGIGLDSVKKTTGSLIITQHHLPLGKIRSICFRLTAKKFQKIVVHSSSIKGSLIDMGIDKGKIQVIDYPVSHPIKLDRKKSKRKLGLNVEEKILLAIGGTRFSKGLDVLLQASKIVKKKYCLVITGKEEYFKEEYIRAQAKALRHTVVIRLGELTDEEFGWYLDAADCIVLPYRKSFDGASGPMTEAVWRRKPVIAPSHGSLGDLVKKCNLGYSFESENVKDLAQKIENFLNDSAAFQWTPEAENFREKISPQTFTARYSELYESIVESN